MAEPIHLLSKHALGRIAAGGQATNATRIFFDTEFIEDGKTIDLVSIGMVRSDGAELYLCNNQAQLDWASPWVRENVLPHLPPFADGAWQSCATIATRIKAFALEIGRPQFWAYYADYDWVALCQLFGRMIDLPKGFPMYCMDLKQWSVMLGNPEHPKQETGEHHALADARWNRDLFTFLSSRTDVPALLAMAEWAREAQALLFEHCECDAISPEEYKKWKALLSRVVVDAD